MKICHFPRRMTAQLSKEWNRHGSNSYSSRLGSSQDPTFRFATSTFPISGQSRWTSLRQDIGCLVTTSTESRQFWNPERRDFERNLEAKKLATCRERRKLPSRAPLRRARAPKDEQCSRHKIRWPATFRTVTTSKRVWDRFRLSKIVAMQIYPLTSDR